MERQAGSSDVGKGESAELNMKYNKGAEREYLKKKEACFFRGSGEDSGYSSAGI
jgi:hypothetical protein